MATRVTAQFRTAEKLEPGTGILGAYEGCRIVEGTSDKPSPVYTFRSLAGEGRFDYWGGKAMLDAALRDMPKGTPVLVVHRGKEKRVGLRKGTEVNVIEVWKLDDNDVVKLAQNNLAFYTTADAVKVPNLPAILQCLGLEPLKEIAKA